MGVELNRNGLARQVPREQRGEEGGKSSVYISIGPDFEKVVAGLL